MHNKQTVTLQSNTVSIENLQADLQHFNEYPDPEPDPSFRFKADHNQTSNFNADSDFDIAPHPSKAN